MTRGNFLKMSLVKGMEFSVKLEGKALDKNILVHLIRWEGRAQKDNDIRRIERIVGFCVFQ